NAMGIGAGTSGVTCASVTPALVRVTPGDPNNSLIFNKTHSKLLGVNAPCGSPMPLPATAAPLTSAEVDLIAAWITAGAMKNCSRLPHQRAEPARRPRRRLRSPAPAHARRQPPRARRSIGYSWRVDDAVRDDDVEPSEAAVAPTVEAPAALRRRAWSAVTV